MDSEALLHNLRIVSKVGEQDKLVTGPRYFLRQPTLLRSVSRWWFGETRHRDIDNLRSLFAAAVNLVIVSAEEKYHTGVSVERVVTEIKGALGGIDVLLRTYHDDHDICVRLETLVNDTHFRLNKFRPGLLVTDEPDATRPALPPPPFQ